MTTKSLHLPAAGNFWLFKVVWNHIFEKFRLRYETCPFSWVPSTAFYIKIPVQKSIIFACGAYFNFTRSGFPFHGTFHPGHRVTSARSVIPVINYNVILARVNILEKNRLGSPRGIYDSSFRYHEFIHSNIRMTITYNLFFRPFFCLKPNLPHTKSTKLICWSRKNAFPRWPSQSF